MNIIKSTANLDAKVQYLLTRSQESVKVSEMANAIIEIAEYALFEDERTNTKTGETVYRKALCFRDNTGTVYGTNSPTFIDEFAYITDLFGDKPRIKVIKKTSKSGRDFVTCTIAEE